MRWRRLATLVEVRRVVIRLRPATLRRFEEGPAMDPRRRKEFPIIMAAVGAQARARRSAVMARLIRRARLRPQVEGRWDSTSNHDMSDG